MADVMWCCCQFTSSSALQCICSLLHDAWYSVAAPTADVPRQIHLEKGVTVNVVFGIKDIDRSNLTSGHVLSEKVVFTSVMPASHGLTLNSCSIARFPCNSTASLLMNIEGAGVALRLLLSK